MENIPQFSIPWENMGKNSHELGGLSEEKKQRINKSVNRMNAELMELKLNGQLIPKEYYQFGKDIVEYAMDSANFTDEKKKNTAITIAEETYVLDREKSRTYYDVNIAGQIFADVTRSLNKFKWDVKQYLLNKVRDATKYSRTFKSPRYINMKPTPQYDKGIGWYVGYNFTRFDLMENEGELFDIQYEYMLEASAQMGRLAHEHILTGTTNEHGSFDDSGEAGSGLAITGLCNNASNQTFTTSTLSTFGNIYKGLKEALADLKKVYLGKTIMITTGGIPAQLDSNFATYEARNEYDEVLKRLVGPDKPIKEWWVTDQLTGAAITTGTQRIVVLKLDPRLMNRLIILPLQTLPSEQKMWKDDVNEVMLAADILRFNPYDTTENAFPVTYSGSLTTADLGFLSNTRLV